MLFFFAPAGIEALFDEQVMLEEMLRARQEQGQAGAGRRRVAWVTSGVHRPAKQRR